MSMDPTRRIAKWNSKYDTTRVKGTLDAMRDQMYLQVQAVFPLITAMELQVKQVLDGLGVSIAQYSTYLCFGREIWHLKRINVSGEAASREARTLINKWVDRGLTQTVLEAIRSQVFDIPAPTTP